MGVTSANCTFTMSSAAETQQEKVPSGTRKDAPDRCFKITELLEQILLELDPQQVLFCALTNRTFMSTIWGSTKLLDGIYHRNTSPRSGTWTLDLNSPTIDTFRPSLKLSLPDSYEVTIGSFNPMLLARVDTSKTDDPTYIPDEFDPTTPLEILVNGIESIHPVARA